MAEISRALYLLRQEISITDEVLGALHRCPSGTTLDASARNAIKKALVLIKGKEAELAKAGDALTAHQQLHAEVESLRQEVRAEEKRIQECAQRLTEADAVLRGPLRDAKRLLEAGRKAEAAEIEVRDVVDYAQRISGITSAPSYWKPGMAMVGFAPPAPRPEMMRAGALSAFAVTTGTSLPAAELLKIAHDLDKPPDRAREMGATEGSTGSDAGSSGGSRHEEDKPRGEKGEGSPERRKRSSSSSSTKRAGGGRGEETSPGKPSRARSASFARAAPPKRPKISLDLDDLDSDSDEESD